MTQGTLSHSARWRRRPGSAGLAILVVAMLMAGCQSRSKGPTVIRIAPDQYRAAFDRAVAISDEHRFAATLRDRRRGIIETTPVISPSMFEPWKTGGYTTAQIIENTANLQRRWVRWEFTPVRFDPQTGQTEPAGPDLLAMDDTPLDLTKATDPMELRVAVFVERGHDPGHRPRTWTTSDTTRAVIVDPETGEPVERRYWVATARDEQYERHLLAAVQAVLPSGTADRDAMDAEPQVVPSGSN